MAKKSVHQEFNPLAIEHFEIDCDPYGIMVDSSGTIETVYVNTSKGLTRTIENIFETNESFEYEIDFSLLSEKITIDVGDDEAEEVEGEFIDIEDTAEEEDEFGIKDQNETGRNFAKGAFDKVEKQIVDAYDKLSDENDRKLFYDYLLTNLMLYFDKFEDELIAELPQTSTEEYEQEKEAGEDAEVAPEEGGEEEPEAEAEGEEEAGEEEEELEL